MLTLGGWSWQEPQINPEKLGCRRGSLEGWKGWVAHPFLVEKEAGHTLKPSWVARGRVAERGQYDQQNKCKDHKPTACSHCWCMSRAGTDQRGFLKGHYI